MNKITKSADMSLVDIDVPDKMHLLLEQALRDIVTVRKSPDVVIRMGEWHLWSPNTPNLFDGKAEYVCFACLAGCWLERGMERHVSVVLNWLPERVKNAAMVLDCLRTGNVGDAARIFYGDESPISIDVEDRIISNMGVPYASDPTENEKTWRIWLYCITRVLRELRKHDI